MVAKKLYNLHHRKPSSIGGSNHPGNTIIVNRYHHEAWHQLFQNKTAQEIADTINGVWLDPMYVFVVRRR